MKQTATATAVMLVIFALIYGAKVVADQRIVVVPVADFLAHGAGYRAPGMGRIQSLISKADKSVVFEKLPLRRARARYEKLETGCVIDALAPDKPWQLQSRELTNNTFWLFVSAGSGIRHVSDVERVATVLGAELYLEPDLKKRFDWTFTTNFKNVIAMLRGARVDAITLSPRYFQSVQNVDFPLRQLGIKPIINVRIGILCKRDPDAAALIEYVENNLASPFDGQPVKQ